MTSRTKITDASGAYIKDFLRQEGHKLVAYSLIPDDPEQIRKLVQLHTQNDTEVILITGGTGISKRDNTFEAVLELIQTPIPGFGELFRSLSYDEIGAASMLSRAEAGIIDSTLVFSMPGSKGAVHLAINSLIMPQIRHMVSELNK